MKFIALFAFTGTITAIAIPAWEVASTLPTGSPLSLLGVSGLLLLTAYSERWRLEDRTFASEPATLHATSELAAERS